MHSLRIMRGRGDGKRIGFPTINLDPSSLTADHGIYAGWLSLAGRRYPVAVHFGPVPTFNVSDISLEAHIIGDAPKEIPAEAVLELVKYLRPVENFPDLDSLQTMIQEDVRQTKESLGL